MVTCLAEYDVIFVTGLPGAGKTTFAAGLAAALGGAPVLSTDIVRAIGRRAFSPNMWLNTVSHEAWQLIGDTPCEENYTQGFRAHADAVMELACPIINDLVQQFRHVVVEGVHAYPSPVLSSRWRAAWVYLELQNPLEMWARKASARRDGRNVWTEHQEVLYAIDGALAGCPEDAKNIVRLRTNIYCDWPFEAVRETLNGF